MAAVQAEKLLKELDNVWVSLGKEQETAGGVLRACAMTLIALNDGDGPAVSETIAGVMHDHPSRAIVIQVQDGEAPLGARVYAQCWMPFGRRQQICCEEIEIQASQQSLADVPSVLRGLLAPDLPVVLWIRNPALLRNPATASLLKMAGKTIVESRGFADWRWLVDEIVRLHREGRVVADLAWTRMTRWRELIAHIFEDPARAGLAKSVREVTIRHSSPEPGPAALYLASWFRGACGVNISTRFEASTETKIWQVQEIRLQGDGIDVRIHRTERQVVAINVNGLQSASVFQVLRECDLLREELSIPGRDPIFARVLEGL
jgi:glucose-6-phosphate dehydrogenase assembly protein OpcA